jgi:hypothetical protein
MLFSAQFKIGSRQVGNRQIPELLTAYLPTAYLSNLFGSGFAGLCEGVIQHRLQLLTSIIRLLLTMIPQQRDFKIGEKNARYSTNMLTSQAESFLSEKEIAYLLTNIPLPGS